MMIILLGLALAASSAPAAEVAMTSTTDVTPAAATTGSLMIIPLASFENPVLPDVHPDQCRFRRGQGQVWLEINRGEAMSFYGGAFPDDLVDLDRPLREGFRNSEKIVINEVTLTWTAAFDHGVLRIEGTSKGPGLPSQTQHFEFRTSSSVRAAESASWRQTSPELSDRPVRVTCADVPAA